MKLEAKQRLRAFKLLPPDDHLSYLRKHQPYVLRMIAKDEFEEIENAVSGVSVYWDDWDYQFFFVKDDQLIGYASFDPNDGYSLAKKYNLPDLDYTMWYKPHATFTKRLQGKGIATFLYRNMLKRTEGSKKAAFITDKHTASAAKVWDRVAEQLGLQVLNYSKDAGLTETPTKRSVKILIRKKR